MVVVFHQRAHMRAFIEKRFPKVGFSRDVFSERAHMRALAEYRVIMGQRAHMRALAEIDPSLIDSCLLDGGLRMTGRSRQQRIA